MKRAVLTVVAAIAVVLSVAACSDEQKRDVEGAGVRVALENTTNDVLSDNDVELEDGLDCSADIADDSTVTGSCTGTDTEGAAVQSTLEGTVDIDEATCNGSLTITVGTETLSDESDHDCLDD